MISIAAMVVLAHLPHLLGFFDPNPLGSRSGLVVSTTDGLIPGQPTMDPNNGFTSQALGHRAAIDWVHLRLPWWNPYEATGTPLAGEMQSAALFPPTLLTLLSNGQLYERMLLEILAGISTFLLLRRLSVAVWASAVGGIAFALNGTFAWFAHAAFNPVAFLPLLLLGIEYAYSASAAGRRGGWWLIAVAGALSLYAGFPEVAYIDALLAVVWAGWRATCLGRDRGRLLSFGAKAAAGAAVAALLATPFLIVSLGYVHDGFVGKHANDFYDSVHLPAEGLSQLLLPYVYGPISGFSDPKGILTTLWGGGGGYITTSLLLFAVLGLLSKGRRGLRLVLAGWIVLATARIYGPSFVGEALGLLPGMSQVTFSRYGFATLELAVVMLAALGLDDLARAPRRRVIWAAAASFLLVAVAAIGARSLADQLGSAYAHQRYYEVAVAFGVGIVLAGVAFALIRDSRTRMWLAALLVTGEALVLFAVPEFAAPRSVKLDMAPVSFLQRNLGSSRFFTLGPLQPNYGTYFGVASLNVNDIPLPKGFPPYVHRRLDAVVVPTHLVGNYGGNRPPFARSPQQELIRNLDGYRAAGVRYVLTPVDQPLPPNPFFTPAFRSPSTLIYRLSGASPYFTASNPRCLVRPDGRRSVRVMCPGPATLVRRETAIRGWRARVDGDAVPIGKADDLFQTVNVGAGSHHVTFDYRPPHITWGYLAFAAGCAWLLVAGLSGRRRRAAA